MNLENEPEAFVCSLSLGFLMNHWLWVAESPTRDNGDGVFLPGNNADILLDSWGDEALEHGNITPHGALVGHTDCVGLPEHWYVKKRADISH